MITKQLPMTRNGSPTQPLVELASLLGRGYIRLRAANSVKAADLARFPSFPGDCNDPIFLDLAAQQSDELAGQWALRRP